MDFVLDFAVDWNQLGGKEAGIGQPEIRLVFPACVSVILPPAGYGPARCELLVLYGDGLKKSLVFFSPSVSTV